MNIRYVGRTPEGNQIFLNPDNVIAVITNRTGSMPAEVLVIGDITYTIQDIPENVIRKLNES